MTEWSLKGMTQVINILTFFLMLSAVVLNIDLDSQKS